MKLDSVAFMLLAGTASLIFVFTSGESSFAQNVGLQFKVGDHVEANLVLFEPQWGDAWRKATITKVFEASRGGNRPQKDSIIVAIADAVASRGSSHGIEASRLAELNIPYAKLRLRHHRCGHGSRSVRRNLPRADVPRGRAVVLRFCQARRAVEVRVKTPLANRAEG